MHLTKASYTNLQKNYDADTTYNNESFMKKYNDTVSNKYFNAPNKPDVIQKRMNNVKSENKYYGNTIQKANLGNTASNIGRIVGNLFGGGEARAAARTADELNGFARTIDAAKKAAKDAGNGASVNVGKLLQQIIKEHSLEPHETAHIIQSLEEIGTKTKSSYLSEYAPSASAFTTTPAPASVASTTSTPSTTTTQPINAASFSRSPTNNKTIASQVRADIASSRESAHKIMDDTIRRHNLTYQDLQEVIDDIPEEYVSSTLKSNLLNSYTSLPGAPRRKATSEPKISVAEEENKRKIKNQRLWDHITSKFENNRVDFSHLEPDEIALIRQTLPEADFDAQGGVISKDQLKIMARLEGFNFEPRIFAPNPTNITRPTTSTSRSANSNVPFGAQPTTVRHEIVVSQAPTPAPVRTSEPARAPEPAPNPFPNSPYSPEQISRYSSSFVAPQQSRKRNFWDRNSALWNAPHKYQQKVNFHTNQYEDLLRGKITDPRQRHQTATDLVNRGFIPRDAANKILSDFGDEHRVAPKLSRVSSKVKSVYQNNFSTSIPLSPERIARNERNKKLAVRAATTYGIGHYALPFVGAVVANELSKPQYTGDVNDPDFDFNEYKKTRWVRNIRDLAPDFFTAKKDVQKSASKTKKLRKGPNPVPGGSPSDVDDAAEAAAADAIVQRVLGRTEYTRNLMQPQEYSTQYLTNMRTGYGAFENPDGKTYERIIDDKGNTNWGRNITVDTKTKSIMDSIKTAVKSSLSSPAIKDWAKAYVAETAKKNTGLKDLSPEQDLRRKVIRSTVSALKPVMKSPFGTAITDKLKRDFNISNPQQLINAGERTAENSVKGVVGTVHNILSFNPMKLVADEFARRGEKMPPTNFKQIHQQEQGSRTRSRRNVATREMLEPFNRFKDTPQYVRATIEKPMTADERKQHNANVANYHALNRQRFEDVKTGQDLSDLNSNNFDTGASRNVGMPSMGLSNRTNEYIGTNKETNKRRDQDVWKSIAWSQGKYKPESKLEEIRLIATLDSLPQTIQAQLKPREKNNIDRLLEFFNPPAKEKKVYTALTPSALAGTSQPVTQTATPVKTVQEQIKATPTVINTRRTNPTPYQNPEALKAKAEREIQAKIQELIRQRGY